MRVVIIGGTGHIGSYLTPRMVEAGHSVVCVSRGLKEPYRKHAAWRSIERVEIDRTGEEAAGNFGERIAKLDAQVVIDLTCYKLDSAEQLLEGLRGQTEHLLHCGTIWVHGPTAQAMFMVWRRRYFASHSAYGEVRKPRARPHPTETSRCPRPLDSAGSQNGSSTRGMHLKRLRLYFDEH